MEIVVICAVVFTASIPVFINFFPILGAWVKEVFLVLVDCDGAFSLRRACALPVFTLIKGWGSGLGKGEWDREEKYSKNNQQGEKHELWDIGNPSHVLLMDFGFKSDLVGFLLGLEWVVLCFYILDLISNYK